MPRLAIVAALEREISALIQGSRRVAQDYEGRSFIFFERDDLVAVCGGIGADAARRAAEAVIALYRPILIQSVGFAGALTANMRVAEIFSPAVVVDARDGSRVEIEGGLGTLVTFMEVASAAQKSNLAQAYNAQAVDMEAAAVAAAARAHGIKFGAIKAISDELTFELPHTAHFIDGQGRFNTASFALFAALRPWLWPRVATLASNSRKASQALSQHLDQRSQKELIPAAPAPQPAATTAFTSRSPK
jgi:adenosylhomocysteine nucleosidase